MRAKSLRVVVTFHTTTAAMAMEDSCMKEGMPGRLIPVPREIHAGEIETSLMLYRYPELVDMTKACTAMFELPGWQTGWSTSDFTSDGVMGDAKAATPEKGKLLYDFMTEKAAAVLRELMASNTGRPARA